MTRLTANASDARTLTASEIDTVAGGLLPANIGPIIDRGLLARIEEMKRNLREAMPRP